MREAAVLQPELHKAVQRGAAVFYEALVGAAVDAQPAQRDDDLSGAFGVFRAVAGKGSAVLLAGRKKGKRALHRRADLAAFTVGGKRLQHHSGHVHVGRSAAHSPAAVGKAQAQQHVHGVLRGVQPAFAAVAEQMQTVYPAHYAQLADGVVRHGGVFAPAARSHQCKGVFLAGDGVGDGAALKKAQQRAAVGGIIIHRAALVQGDDIALGGAACAVGKGGVQPLLHAVRPAFGLFERDDTADKRGCLTGGIVLCQCRHAGKDVDYKQYTAENGCQSGFHYTPQLKGNRRFYPCLCPRRTGGTG